jgi:hypothetical protein
VSVVLAAALMGALVACGDPGGRAAAEASREYAAFLRGDEDGSIPTVRASHLDRAIALADRPCGEAPEEAPGRGGGQRHDFGGHDPVGRALRLPRP